MPYIRVVRWLLVPMSLLSIGAAAQVPDTAARHLRWREHHDELTLLAGYHQGRYGFAELGIGRNQYGSNHHPYDIGYFAGAEMRVDRPDIWGVKAGAYVDGGFAMGAQYIHYMQASKSMEVLRFECGIGAFKARMVYAYNLRLSKPALDGVNTHMLGLYYAFRVKRLPRDDARRPLR